MFPKSAVAAIVDTGPTAAKQELATGGHGRVHELEPTSTAVDRSATKFMMLPEFSCSFCLWTFRRDL